MNDVGLSVILPAYREEDNLRLLLPRLEEVLDRLGEEWEILVVDLPDPVDGTRALCEGRRGVRWMPRAGGTSYGDAYRTGIGASRGRWVVLMDADGSHDPALIGELRRRAPGNDVVIASRYTASGGSENPLHLVLMSRALNWTAGRILGIRARDVSNSFRIYDGALLRSLELRCRNFDIIQEILVKSARARPRLRVLEVPCTFRRRMFGRTKRNLAAFAATYLATMVRLRLGR
jgi:dolichol-phosphate mannosyltransferase